MFSSRPPPPPNRGEFSQFAVILCPNLLDSWPCQSLTVLSVHVSYFSCGQAAFTSMACHVCGCKGSSLQAVTDLAPSVRAQVAQHHSQLPMDVELCSLCIHYITVNPVRFLLPNLLPQLEDNGTAATSSCTVSASTTSATATTSAIATTTATAATSVNGDVNNRIPEWAK